MNKARKKTHKIGISKRLTRGSLILSATRFVSSRFIRFFEKGFISPLFGSVEKVDEFAKEKITEPIFKKVGYHKKFSSPLRNGIASFFGKNRIFQKLLSLQNSILMTSLRTLGIFLFTFGIYTAAIFMLKHFVAITGDVAHTDDIIVAALSVIAGLLLTLFGDKSVLSAFGNGKITGSLLSGVLGVNDSSLDRVPKKKKTAVGVSFLLGSVLGVVTMFICPRTLLLAIVAAVVFAVILNIPEFGLLLSVAVFPLLSVKWIGLISMVTAVSFVFKCLRLKRNLRFGTADGIMLILFLFMFMSCASSGDGIETGEGYLLCFMSLYFAVKNLVVSERLVIQTFHALVTGVFLAMAVYILGEFAHYIPYTQFRALAEMLVSNRLKADMLVIPATAVMPFAFSSFSSYSGRRKAFWFVVLSALCAFVSDSFLFYAMSGIALFVYIAFAYKAPCGAVLGGAVVLIPGLMLASDFTRSKVVTLFADKAYDSTLAINPEKTGTVFWDGISTVGGALVFAVLCVAVLLILQRVFATVIASKNPRVTLICGTVAASAVMIVAQMFMFNFFADLRVVLMIWFILGLCGSVYKVYYNLPEGSEGE